MNVEALEDVKMQLEMSNSRLKTLRQTNLRVVESNSRKIPLFKNLLSFWFQQATFKESNSDFNASILGKVR